MGEQPVMISMYDKTGHMAEPFRDAGWRCICIDFDRRKSEVIDGIEFVKKDARHWMPEPDLNVKFFAAFPPCDHLAVSGARWFNGKGLRSLAESIDLFGVAAGWAEYFRAPYMIENPVSVASSHWRRPDFVFHPWYYAEKYEPADNYTKKTCLWTGGGFVMPPKGVEPVEIDDRIHKAAPGEGRKDFRSATPKGFARAVFDVNFQTQGAHQ